MPSKNDPVVRDKLPAAAVPDKYSGWILIYLYLDY